MAWTSLNEEASWLLSVPVSSPGWHWSLFIPTDRYIVRVYSNVTTEVEFVLKTSCGYLLADIPSLPSGELVLLACLARLRSDAGAMAGLPDR